MEIFAHRAGTVWAPENSLTGIQRCVAMGIGMELDVCRCDDALVLTHVDGVEGIEYPKGDKLSQFPLYDLRDLDLTGGDPYRGIDRTTVVGMHREPMATLAEALMMIRGTECTALLDLKQIGEEPDGVPATEQEVLELVARLEVPPYQIIMGVRNDGQVERVPAINPDVGTLIFGGLKDEEFEAYLDSEAHWIRLWGNWLDNAPEKLPKRVVAAGKKVMIMTGSMNSIGGGSLSRLEIRQIQLLAGQGLVDGVIVNDPGVAHHYFAD